MPFNFHRNLILTSKSHNPIFNMSLGNYLTSLYSTAHTSKKVLLLSSSTNCVSIGRAQNCYRECRLDKMKEDNVPLVRRNTGGGACFLDLGTRLFSFIDREPIERKNDNYDIVIRSLQDLGCPAIFSGKNDICVNGFKVSGSAFSQLGDVKKHHGTILLNINKSKLVKYLNPNNLKLESKGIKSVDQRVMNLMEMRPTLTMDELDAALGNRFDWFYGEKSERVIVGEDELMSSSEFREIYENFSSEKYVYGSNPDVISCTLAHRFSFGIVELLFECNNSVIVNCHVNSDSVEEVVMNLPEYFVGARMDSELPMEFLRRIGMGGISNGDFRILMEIYAYIEENFGKN